MKSRIRPLGITALALLLTCAAASTVFGAATRYKPGLNFIDRDLVSPGHVIYTADGVIRVIDLNGRLVNEIQPPGPGDDNFQYSRPLDNGNILARYRPEEGNDSIVELDQDGNFLWEFQATDEFIFHHDHSRLPNGNTLIMCARSIVVPEISPDELRDDCLLEVTPAGDIVWDWQTADHFDDFNFPQEWKDKISELGGDWAHANAASVIPRRTSHTDPRFAPGNIIISYRHINMVVIVDRSTGDIVWTTDLYQTIGQHDPKMLPDNLEGGGNILIFDNGYGGWYNFGGPEVVRQYSRVIEIDPTDNSIAWEYTAPLSDLPIHFFFSWFISSAQRLPNGNTFIDEGAFGRFFEVTPDGTIVWEFINPILGPFQGLESNRVYRAEKVGAGWSQ